MDGKFGLGGFVEVPNEKCLTLDLGAEKSVSGLVFSRDRTGLYVDGPVIGYVWEGSSDGTTWQTLVDSAKSGAAPIGQVNTIKPTPVRYLRLRLYGQYGRPALVDEVTVYGP